MQNEMRDRHLVKDNPQSMTESMFNFAYAKNKEVYLRYANGEEDIELCKYIAQLTETNGCLLSADDVMNGSCIEGCDCEMAVLYILGVQAAGLRERLKYYEDLEDKGLLQILPCKVGDTIYLPWKFDGVKSIACLTATHIIFDREHNYIKTDFHTDDEAYYDKYKCGRYEFEDFGKTVFLTKSEAEQKLKEMRGGNGNTT